MISTYRAGVSNTPNKPCYAYNESPNFADITLAFFQWSVERNQAIVLVLVLRHSIDRCYIKVTLHFVCILPYSLFSLGIKTDLLNLNTESVQIY